jgi:hypothetical protein
VLSAMASTPAPPPPTPPMQVIEGVALVASALPAAQRSACVQQMLDTLVEPMQRVLQATAGEAGGSAPGTPTAGGGPAQPPAAGGQLSLVLPLMERVTTIFRAVKDPEDVAEALVRLWPWVETALGEWMRLTRRHVQGGGLRLLGSGAQLALLTEACTRLCSVLHGLSSPLLYWFSPMRGMWNKASPAICMPCRSLCGRRPGHRAHLPCATLRYAQRGQSCRARRAAASVQPAPAL